MYDLIVVVDVLALFGNTMHCLILLNTKTRGAGGGVNAKAF
mgnify:FL=1